MEAYPYTSTFLSFLLGGLMAMSSCYCSLPLLPPPGTFDPGSLVKTRSEVSFITRNNVDESRNTSKRSSSVGPKPNLLSTTTRRREAIGMMGLGLVELIAWQFPWQSRIAEAVETAPCELTVAPSGLAYCDKVVGTGPEAVKGQYIKAHYVGKLENGKVFDSSYSRGKPLIFKVGVGEVIKGWDEGILGGDGVPPMLAGGKRILKLPPELGYGVRGAGCRGGSCIIPPESVLLFDVEFVGKG